MDKSQCFIPKRFKWNNYLCKGKKNRNNTLNIGKLLRFFLIIVIIRWALKSYLFIFSRHACFL